MKLTSDRSCWQSCLELLALSDGILVGTSLHCPVSALRLGTSGGKSTSASSEAKVAIAPESMPWQTDRDGNKDFKYQYHPGGDTSKPLKEAPSALNVVIVPDVNLPKVRI